MSFAPCQHDLLPARRGKGPARTAQRRLAATLEPSHAPSGSGPRTGSWAPSRLSDCPNLGRTGHGSWFYRLDVGTDPVTGRRRERRKGGFATKRDAERAMAALAQAVNSGEYRDDNRQTAAQRLTAWIDRKAANGLRPVLRRARGGGHRHHVQAAGAFSPVVHGSGLLTPVRLRGTGCGGGCLSPVPGP